MANTGRVEKQQRDVNPNSNTFGQTRFVDAGYDDLTACPLPVTYRSAAISENVTKNNCPSGQYGSTVPYTLAYGAYTSQASQADADQQAQTFFNANKQAYANANGSCNTTPSGGITWLPVYTQSGPYQGCFACQMYNQDDPSDIRAATDAEAQTWSVPTNSSGTQACGSCSQVITP